MKQKGAISVHGYKSIKCMNIVIVMIYTRKIKKNIFNKIKKRCRDVKTLKACEEGWEANIVTKIKQTTSI